MRNEWREPERPVGRMSGGSFFVEVEKSFCRRAVKARLEVFSTEIFALLPVKAMAEFNKS